MSSESDNNHDHDTSPRKRRRLGSLDHAHNRKLFNDHVTGAASHPDVNESVQHYSTQIGSSLWSSTEQARFFVALERLGKDDLPGIARAIETKTTIETRAFLDLLHDAASKQGDTKLTLRDIPAAVDVGHACSQQLDDAAEALAWYQEKLEASQEQERYGDLWLITPSIAEDIEHAVNGVTRPPTSASSILEREPKRHGNGVNGYVYLALLHTVSPSD
jgi:RNA polymerase I-specific transcription initiation factor RRN5